MPKKNFLKDSNQDTLMRIILALAKETYVIKDRLSMLEKIIDKKGFVTKSDFSEYILSDSEKDEVKVGSDRFINNILKPIVSDYTSFINKKNDE